MQFLTDINKSVFFFLHSFSGRWEIIDTLIIFFGEYFIYIIGAIFIWVAFIDFKKTGVEPIIDYTAAMFGALCAKLVVGWGIESFYTNSRPFIELSLPHLLTDFTSSFPSGHTIFMFALATSVFFFNRRFSYFLFAGGAVIGLARIAGGVHYPSDIVGGILLGSGIAVFVHIVWHYLLNRSSEKEEAKKNVKTLAFIFLFSFILNFIWEQAQSVLYDSYKGLPINNFILFRASIADACIVSVLAIPFLYNTFLRNRLWIFIPLALLIASLIEWNALNVGWWTYNDIMPRIPLLKTGLAPTVQLGLTGYIAYRFFIRK